MRQFRRCSKEPLSSKWADIYETFFQGKTMMYSRYLTLMADNIVMHLPFMRANVLAMICVFTLKGRGWLALAGAAPEGH